MKKIISMCCRFSTTYQTTSILMLLFASSANAMECGMAMEFSQPDGSAKGGLTSVWASKDKSALLFVESLAVNTDGTRRSYSVDDFWGEKDALNNLCNAMSDGCKKLSRDDLRERRIATQKAFADGWPSEQLRNTKISASIIPFKSGKPCPAVDGFLISATSLHRPKITDVCDINNYVDSLVAPAIVIPKNRSETQLSEFALRNAKVGDLVITMVPGASKPVYAVIGDTGPVNELGEGSLALNGKLLGKTKPPANYIEVKGRKQFVGKAWTVPRAIVLIFPGTRDVASPYMTPDRIEESGKRLFESWGGVDRMNACAEEYGR
jgi:hypothetical protein